MRNHLFSLRRDAARQKRGGSVIVVSLEDAEAFDVPGEPERADHWFDRRWACSVLRRAMERMEARYRERGRAAIFSELKAGLISPDLLKPYAEIGASLGMKESQVKLEVHRARHRLADELRAEVDGTLEPGANVDEELRYLLTAMPAPITRSTSMVVIPIGRIYSRHRPCASANSPLAVLPSTPSAAIPRGIFR